MIIRYYNNKEANFQFYMIITNSLYSLISEDQKKVTMINAKGIRKFIDKTTQEKLKENFHNDLVLNDAINFVLFNYYLLGLISQYEKPVENEYYFERTEINKRKLKNYMIEQLEVFESSGYYTTRSYNNEVVDYKFDNSYGDGNMIKLISVESLRTFYKIKKDPIISDCVYY